MRILAKRTIMHIAQVSKFVELCMLQKVSVDGTKNHEKKYHFIYLDMERSFGIYHFYSLRGRGFCLQCGGLKQNSYCFIRKTGSINIPYLLG